MKADNVRLKRLLKEAEEGIEDRNETVKLKDNIIEQLRRDIIEAEEKSKEGNSDPRDDTEEVKRLKIVIKDTKEQAKKYVERLKNTNNDVNQQVLRLEKTNEELQKVNKNLIQEKQSHLFLLNEKNESDNQVAKLQEELHRAIKDKEIAKEHYKVLEDRLKIENLKEKRDGDSEDDENVERIYVEDSDTDDVGDEEFNREDDGMSGDVYEDDGEFQIPKNQK